MSQVTILGASQEQLLKNTQAVLEDFQGGRPLRRMALVRKALATFLGQSNQHLPAAKFADDNANLEARLESLLSGFDFLQDWGSGNDEYIDRYFECRALDDNAEKDDITVDYRLSFNMESKFAYFIIGKNYGDGMNDCVEVPLEMVPHLPHWQPEGGFHLPDNVNGKEELFCAYAEMLELYLAVKGDVLLADVFLSNDAQKAAIVGKREPRLSTKSNEPTLEFAGVRKALLEMIEQRHEKRTLESEYDVVAGAIQILQMFGERYSGIITSLSFQAMTGRISDKIYGESMQYIVRTFEYGSEGYTSAKIEKKFKTQDVDDFYPEDDEIDAAIDAGGDLEVLREDEMKLRYAWDVKNNRPYTDKNNHLLAL